MEDLVYILYLNNKVIGVFDSKSSLDTFIIGCDQNDFFCKKNIYVESFVRNSCLKYESSNHVQISENVSKNVSKTVSENVKENQIDRVKETDEKNKMKTAIKYIAAKNFKQINEWKKKNPESDDYDSQKHMDYHQIVIHSMGGATAEEDDSNYNKIIRKVAKESVINKEITGK
jgi:Rps23 Pro-64 3,4-dihydroxylase Tpa1-like proline 4-hydroxylase